MHISLTNTNPEAVPSSEGLDCKESKEKGEKETEHPQPKTLSSNTQEMLDSSQTQILANYFPVTFEPNWCIYQYRVNFFPPCERLSTDEETVMVNSLAELGAFVYKAYPVSCLPGAMFTAERLPEVYRHLIQSLITLNLRCIVSELHIKYL